MATEKETGLQTLASGIDKTIRKIYGKKMSFVLLVFIPEKGGYPWICIHAKERLKK